MSLLKCKCLWLEVISKGQDYELSDIQYTARIGDKISAKEQEKGPKSKERNLMVSKEGKELTFMKGVYN